MHSIDRHRKAIAHANDRTLEKFGVHGPYQPGSEAHAFWLERYDIFIRVDILYG